MKHMYRITYKDVKDCFLYVPPNVVKKEEFAKMVYGTTGTSYFSVVYGKVNDIDSWDAYVGLNASYAKDLGLSENELVTITFLKSLPKLNSVSCTHSTDDLEVLELSKDRLEGKILHQVKVVWPGQVFPVWLGKNFSFNIKVESLSPPCSVGILSDGTELDLQPGNDISRVNSIVQQEKDIAPSSTSIEFRACQMPAPLEEEVKVGAALYAQDWPDCWPPSGLCCRFQQPEGSTWVDALIARLMDNPAQQRCKLPLPNILLAKHLLAALGLNGNGHHVNVMQISNTSPHVPAKDPADDSEPTWSPMFSGPLQHVVEEGVASLELGLRLTPLAEAFNPFIHPRFSHSVLVIGARGTGRSTMAKEIARCLSGAPDFVHISTISCRGLVGKRPEVCGKMLRVALDECFACQPSGLFLDDLDCLAPHIKPSEDTTPEGIHSARIGEMVSVMIWEAIRGRSGHSDRVVVMATAVSPGNLNSLLVSARGAHIFTTVLAIPEMDTDLRGKMLAVMLGCQEYGDKNESARKSLRDISLRTAGFVAIDLADLSERAMFDARRRTASRGGSGNTLDSSQRLGEVIGQYGVMPEDLESALCRTCPLSLHGMQLVEGISGGRGEDLWSGVGGLAGAKKKLEETVLWPLKYQHLFKNLPIKPRRGILLYGAPGTGKTHLVSSLVGHCGIRLINVKGPELLSKYIGASEEAVRNIFQKAYSARPCVLFFDEFESLAPRRGHDSTGVTDRVVNQLLTQLDGVEEGVANGMVVVAATTRPDLVDPALLRPGRLDTPVLCPMPQEEDRVSILRELGRRLLFDNDVDLAALAKLTLGFTGADLQAVLYTSQIISLKSNSGSMGGKSPVVKWSHVLESLKQTKPSLTKEEAEKYEKSYSLLMDSNMATTMAGMKVSLA